MKWPSMNLGAAADWGRAVEKQLNEIDRERDRQKVNERNVDKSQNSTASSLGRQVQGLASQAQEIIEQQKYLASLYSKSMTKEAFLLAPVEVGEGFIEGEPEHSINGIATTGFVNITVTGVIRATKGTGAMTFRVLEEDGSEWFSPNQTQALRISGSSIGASFSYPFHVPKNRRMTYVPNYYYYNPVDSTADPVRFANRSITMQVLSTLDE